MVRGLGGGLDGELGGELDGELGGVRISSLIFPWSARVRLFLFLCGVCHNTTLVLSFSLSTATAAIGLYVYSAVHQFRCG